MKFVFVGGLCANIPLQSSIIYNILLFSHIQYLIVTVAVFSELINLLRLGIFEEVCL